MGRDHAPEGPARHVGNHAGVGGASTIGKYTLVERVQCDAASTEAAETPEVVKAAATRGTSGPPMALPHGDRIQRLFGRHDVRGVRAYVGGAAAGGAAAMGAEAFATGDQVAFGRAPDLHTAAHEAAHVVQQRAGVHLKGGVGQVGDRHEQHADAVADRVVQGESAEPLLDQLCPATGHTAGGGAAPIQRLRARIHGATHDITKADLDDPKAVEALFNRLQLRIPSNKQGHQFVNDHRTRLNKIAAAIEAGSVNWPIFMGILEALVDDEKPNWAAWDANEVNLAPDDAAAQPGGTIPAQLKALVEASKHQEALDLLRARYRPAAAVHYTVKAVSEFKLPEGQVVSNAAYAVTVGTVISVHQIWIERFLLVGQVADLLNVIEHEATHVKQNSSAPGVTRSDDTDVREFEAYCREIQVTIQRCAFAPDQHLATRVQFEKAVTAAEQHRANALGRQALVTHHAVQWEQIRDALPATRAHLDRTDDLRNVYTANLALLGNKFAEHRELHEQMRGLDYSKPGAQGSAKALADKAQALKIPHLLARLPASAARTAAAERYYEEEEAFRDLVRGRVPRPSTARAVPAVATSSSSLSTPPPATSAVKLAPPEEDDEDGGVGYSRAASPSAAPPPSSSSSAPLSVPKLSPPPSSSSSAPLSVPKLSPPPSSSSSSPAAASSSQLSAPVSVPKLSPPPSSSSSPAAASPASSSQPPESARPASSTQPDDDADDNDFGEFQSADE